eukprot:6346371-Pyramimonas_sp.AAC.1
MHPLWHPFLLLLSPPSHNSRLGSVLLVGGAQLRLAIRGTPVTPMAAIPDEAQRLITIVDQRLRHATAQASAGLDRAALLHSQALQLAHTF